MEDARRLIEGIVAANSRPRAPIHPSTSLSSGPSILAMLESQVTNPKSKLSRRNEKRIYGQSK